MQKCQKYFSGSKHISRHNYKKWYKCKNKAKCQLSRMKKLKYPVNNF